VENLIDRKRAAELIGVSVTWLDRRRPRGEGPPYYEIGGVVRYDVADIQAWLSTHRKSCDGSK